MFSDEVFRLRKKNPQLLMTAKLDFDFKDEEHIHEIRQIIVEFFTHKYNHINKYKMHYNPIMQVKFLFNYVERNFLQFVHSHLHKENLFATHQLDKTISKPSDP